MEIEKSPYIQETAVKYGYTRLGKQDGGTGIRCRNVGKC